MVGHEEALSKASRVTLALSGVLHRVGGDRPPHELHDPFGKLDFEPTNGGDFQEYTCLLHAAASAWQLFRWARGGD